MRSVLYTEKTVSQCMTALNERLQTRGSKNLEGWVEKNGSFGLSLSSPLIGKISRRTHLRGKVEREAGVTLVRINVPSGATLVGQIVIFLACALLALALIASEALIPGILILAAGAAFYVPLAGDQKNSPLLVSEVQRTLKASTRRPKKSTESKAASPKSLTRRAPTSTSTPGSPRK